MKSLSKILTITLLYILTLNVSTFAMITEEVDVAVVGGGLAGLTAAVNLHEKGVKHSLYEAKETLGGRTYSVTTAEGTVFNMGGEWIDSDHKRMHALAQKLGLDLQKETYANPVLVALGGDTISMDDKIQLFESIVEKLKRVIKGMKQSPLDYYQAGTEVPYSRYKSLADILPGDLTEDERRTIEAYVEGSDGASTSDLQAPLIVSLKKDIKEFLDLFKYKQAETPQDQIDSVAFQHRVAGGMSTMIGALRDRLDGGNVHIGHRLTRIFKDTAERFHLIFDDGGEGREVIAKSVVMTIPFSVLRSITLDTTLALPKLCLDAINTLTYGTNAKIQIPLKEEEELTPFQYFVHGATKTLSWNPVSGKGLTIFMGGDTGKTLSEATAPPLAQSVLKQLGGTGGVREGLQIKNWSADPFAKGSYSTAGVNQSPKLGTPSNTHKGVRKFAEPVGGLVFAGEHTSLDYAAYMEGAVRSGELGAELAAQHLL